MAFIVPFIPAIVAVVGTAIAVDGQRQAARAAGQAASQNEAFNAENAKIALEQGEMDVVQQREVNYRRLSGVRAAVGASGIAMDGSALDVLESSAANAEHDIQTIRYNASMKARGYYNSADLDHQRATSAREEGMYRAASSALIGGSRAYAMAPSGVGTPVPGLQTGSTAQPDFSAGYY